MKLKTPIYLSLILVGLALTACNQKSSNTTSSISSEDSMKIAFYDKYFAPSSDISKSINKVVRASAADSCVNRLDTIVNIKKDINRMKKMLETQSVGFRLNELTDWINQNLDSTKVDEIRICFGVYDKKYLDEYNNNQSVKFNNRLTVFLWPYKNGSRALSKMNGDEIQPFNIGTLYP